MLNIRCDQQLLIEAVGNVGRAVTNHSNIPALEGILLRASGDSLYLAGYDLDMMGITTTIEADVIEPGEIVLNAKLFGEIVRKLPDGIVSLQCNEKNVTKIRCSASEFSITGISAADYPEIPSVDDGISIVLQQDMLRTMIRQTLFCVAQVDAARPVHTGTLFELEDGELRLVSVDGSRLAMCTENVQSQETMKFVVPGRTLSEVLKLLSDEKAPMSLAVGRRHVVLEIGGYAVISRLLDGEFLQYQRIIQQESTTEITVKTRALIQGVDRASLVINDRMKSPLICDFGDQKIKITCTTQLGSASDTVPAQIDGLSEEMGFNSRYLLDALKNTECDEVRIELNGALSPMKIRPKEGNSFLFLVLPVRLKK